MHKAIAIMACGMLLAACPDGAAPPDRETGTDLFRAGFERAIVDAQGREAGRIVSQPGEKGLTLRIAARGLPPGQHGMHLHEAGRCDPPDFTTAGGHWNAAGKRHGHDNLAGPHDGDLGNIAIAARDAVKKEALRRAGIGYVEVVAGDTPAELRRVVERLVGNTN